MNYGLGGLRVEQLIERNGLLNWGNWGGSQISILLLHSTFLLSVPDTLVTQNLNPFTSLSNYGSKIDLEATTSLDRPGFTSCRFNTIIDEFL